MDRSHYKIFSQGIIAGLTVPNRLVRSATWDPSILTVGQMTEVERLEAILQGGKVDFIALCRPIIREPNLPNRWRAGIGRRLPECISCNSCLYAMIVHPGRPEPGLVTCVCKGNKRQHHMAQKWLVTWKESQAS